MSHSCHGRARSFPGLLACSGFALAMIVLLSALASPSTSVAAAPNYGQPVAGQRVYDNAHILTAAEIADLERRAAAVAQAGAPTIVYLQQRSASYDQTERDARDLMDAWDIESAPGARDGIVVFVNLKPDAIRHGQAALYAGMTLVNDGRLPKRELQRIYDREMRGFLEAERTADGIGVGLDTLQRDLTIGPPPPPPPPRTQQIAATLAGWPLVLLAALALAGMAMQMSKAWRMTRRRVPNGPPTAALPDALPPAVVGALVTRTIDAAQAEATILDLGARGALTIEPEGTKKVHIRLRDDRSLQSPYERAVWAALQAQADESGVVSARNVGRLPSRWREANRLLRAELEARGWYDPTVHARRRPLYVTGALLALLTVIALVVVAVGHANRSGIIVVMLALGAALPFVVAALIPVTTAAGDQAAAPWRGYRDGLKERRSHDLDRALPYAVAMGATRGIDRELRDASEQGYAPAWFIRAGDTDASRVGFYVYWGAFHSTMSPSGAGVSGGASAGGAGGGGSF